MRLVLGAVAALVLSVAQGWAQDETESMPAAEHDLVASPSADGLAPGLPVESVAPDVGEVTPPSSTQRGLRTAAVSLPVFGYDLFQRLPGLETLPVALDPEYPVGPGDEVVIEAWGQVELSHRLTVDREGAINIPRVGRLQVAGVTLRELEPLIIRYLSRSYSSIPADPAAASAVIDVTLGTLRTVQVYVIGEVEAPGAYVVPGTATVLAAVSAAGGPLPRASLRQIELRRHGQLAARVDFYRFLLDGDFGEGVRIQHGDVVRVPPHGPSVGLQGLVHRPARYEMVAGEGLRDLIDIAGGLLAEAYARRLQVDRIVANERREVLDVDYAALVTGNDDFALHDGDRVTVAGIPDRFLNAVSIGGVVKRPGTYQLRSGMQIRDLVDQAEGLLPEAYRGRAHLTRTHPDLRRELIPVNLERALAGGAAHDLVLEPLDQLTVFSIHAFRDPQWVHVDGLVRAPGRYELLDGMTVQDLVAAAGGLQEEAHLLGAEVARSNPDADPQKPAVEVLTVSLRDRYEVGADVGPAALALRDGDRVFVRRNPEFEPQGVVEISGQVRLPGRYVLRSSQDRISDLVARAGGLRHQAYPEGMRLQRQGAGLVEVDLVAALSDPGGAADVVLQQEDSIHIPTQPATLTVSGAVYRPGPVAFRRGRDVADYLESAGGPTRAADAGRLYVVLPNGDVRVTKRFLWLWRRWPEVLPGARIVVPERPAD